MYGNNSEDLSVAAQRRDSRLMMVSSSLSLRYFSFAVMVSMALRPRPPLSLWSHRWQTSRRRRATLPSSPSAQFSHGRRTENGGGSERKNNFDQIVHHYRHCAGLCQSPDRSSGTRRINLFLVILLETSYSQLKVSSVRLPTGCPLTRVGIPW